MHWRVAAWRVSHFHCATCHSKSLTQWLDLRGGSLGCHPHFMLTLRLGMQWPAQVVGLGRGRVRQAAAPQQHLLTTRELECWFGPRETDEGRQPCSWEWMV